MGSVTRFEDLEAWQEALDLSVSIYRTTKKFPSSEIYSLTNQMQRASSSVSANIAEGFSRYGTKEKLQFYRIAAGSLTELKSFCYLSQKIGYLDQEELSQLIDAVETTHKLINALIRSIKERS
jgi:four helix bundle protein